MDTSQLLTFGLLFAGFLLFNYLFQRARQRARDQQLHEPAQLQQASPLPESAPIEAGWGRTPDRRSIAPSVEETRRAETSVPPPPAALQRGVPMALFRSTQDLRRAIVVMTVLGPCRALDPHDRR